MYLSDTQYKVNKMDGIITVGRAQLAPVWINQVGVFRPSIELKRINKKHQKFEPLGHYSRPDITQLTVNKQRHSTLKLNDN